MRAAHALILVFAVALFGLFSWLMFSGSDSPPVAAPAVVDALPPAQTEAAPEPEAQLERPEQGVSTPVRNVMEQTVAPAAEKPEVAANAPEIIGQVVDAGGQPVPDAWVRVGPSGFLGAAALEQEDDDASRLPFYSKNQRDVVRTGADGRFALRGPRPGAFDLSVRKGGFVPHRRSEIALPSDASYELGTIVLEDSVVLTGRVIDSAGRGVGGAKLLERSADEGMVGLRIIGAGGGSVLAETDADGSFRIDELANGPYQLLVTSLAHPDKLTSGETQQIGQWVENVVIELEDGYEIHGRVANFEDFAGKELRVVASPLPEGQEDAGASSFLIIGTTDGEARFADVDQGQFVVRGLRGGRSYRLQAMQEGRFRFFGDNQSKAVVAKAGERGVLLDFEPSSTLAFQVVDAETAQPITEFEASAGIQFPMPLVNEEGHVQRTHPDGRVRFEGLRVADANARAELEISAQGYQRYNQNDIALIPGGDVDLGVISLKSVPMVHVRVVDDRTGAAIEDARVTLNTVEPGDGRSISVSRSIRIGDDGEDVQIGSDGSESGRTDETGLASVNSFEGRDCQVSVAHADFAKTKSEVFAAPAGSSYDLEVRMRPGGSVRVTVLDATGEPLAGRRVEHRAGPISDQPSNYDFGWAGSSSGKHVTNSDGVVVFEHLAPGVHRFRPSSNGQSGAAVGGGGRAFVFTSAAGSSDEAWNEIEVVEDAETELTLTAALRVQLTGVVREDGIPLSGAQLALTADDGSDDPVSRMMHSGPSAKTNGQGEYTFDDLKPGRYTLSVNHASRQMEEEFDVDVTVEGGVRDIDLSVAVVEGRIVDEEGEALAGIKVWAEKARDTGGGPRPQVMMISANVGAGGSSVMMHDGTSVGDNTAYTDEDGRYELRGVQSDKEIQVVAEGPDVQPTRSEDFIVAPGQVRTGVDLEMVAAGSIEVLCVRADGSVSDQPVLCTASFEGVADEPPDSERQIIQGGSGVLEGLAPGPWKVSLRSIGLGGGGNEPIPDQTVEVRVGESVQAQFSIP